MLSELFWKGIAKVVSQPIIADWIIETARKTPHSFILSDGIKATTIHVAEFKDPPTYLQHPFLYMGRFSLINPYVTGTKKNKYDWVPFSIRVHYIKRKDLDAHLHDHPYDYARTILLKGKGYWEERIGNIFWRRVGDTIRLDNGMFHRINHVPEEGMWTLFITKKTVSDWGFLVDGVKIPHEEYFRTRSKQ